MNVRQVKGVEKPGEMWERISFLCLSLSQFLYKYESTIASLLIKYNTVHTRTVIEDNMQYLVSVTDLRIANSLVCGKRLADSALKNLYRY